MKNSIKYFTFFLICLTTFNFGCKRIDTDPDANETGSISAHLIWEENQNNNSRSIIAPASVPASTVTIRALISASDMTTMQKDFDSSAGSGSISGIPAGENRTLTLFGLNSSGTQIYKGETTSLTVNSGKTTYAGTIAMVSSALTGVFIDSAVEGINYTTATQSGQTNSNGEFSYIDGEVITFSIGGIDLPAATASTTMTPLTLVGTTDINDTSVTNIARLLQSIDFDGDSLNGITILTQAHTAAENLSNIQFDSETFDLDVNTIVTESGSVNNTLVAAITARNHLRYSINPDQINPDKIITDYRFLNSLNDALSLNVTAEINGTNILAIVPFGTDVSNLIATFSTTGESASINGVNQISGTTPNDFAFPLTFKVLATDNSSLDYVVSTNDLTISSFKFLASDNNNLTTDVTAKIAGTYINITMPLSVNLRNLVATFVTTGESVKINNATQISGTTPNDFSSLVTYTAIAPGGSFTQNFTVAVNEYINNNDGTISATYTDLMWKQTTEEGTYTQNGGYYRCRELESEYFAGYNGWRVPSIYELRTLSKSVPQPTINTEFFPDTQATKYWSSLNSWQWAWSFSSGREITSSPYYHYPIRCVRTEY